MEAFAMPHAGDRLQDAVDALVDESLDDVSTHALAADLIDMRRAVDRLEAEFLRRLHRFHRAHGAQADGALTTGSWLRHRCGMTVKAAAYRVRLARTLGELPVTLDSARAGRASLGNVTMIAHLADDVGVAQVAPLERIPTEATVHVGVARDGTPDGDAAGVRRLSDDAAGAAGYQVKG
jgi:hypothetical protein